MPVYEAFRQEILSDLEQALPVDVVLLQLHGAMSASGCDDCEGDLLKEIRKLAGPGTVIGAELDLHCLLSPAMVEYADLLVSYKGISAHGYHRLRQQVVSLVYRYCGRPVTTAEQCV